MFTKHAQQSVIELQIQCSNLKDKDTFSKSDPKCVVYLVDAATHRKLSTLGQTETINNNLNPHFRKTIPVNQHQVTHQHLLEFSVQDSDGLRNDNLGSCYISLPEVMNSPSGVSRRLHGNGQITVFASDKRGGSVSFMLRGIKIKSMDFMSKSDPFFVMRQDGQELYRSEHKDNTKNPTWKGFELGMNRIKMDRDVEISVYDYDGPSMRPDLIGSVRFIPNYIMNNQISRELTMLSSRGKSSGIICVDQCQMIQKKMKHQAYGAMTHMPHMPQQNYHHQPPNLMHHATAPPIPSNYGVQNQPGYPARPAMPYAQQQPPMPYGQQPQMPYGQQPQMPYGQAPPAAASAPYGMPPQPYGQPPAPAPYGQPPQPYGQPQYPPQQQPSMYPNVNNPYPQNPYPRPY